MPGMSIPRMLTSCVKTRSGVPVTSRRTLDHAVFTMLAIVIPTGGLGMGILVVHSRAASFVPIRGTVYGSLVTVDTRRFRQKVNVSCVCW